MEKYTVVHSPQMQKGERQSLMKKTILFQLTQTLQKYLVFYMVQNILQHVTTAMEDHTTLQKSSQQFRPKM